MKRLVLIDNETGWEIELGSVIRINGEAHRIKGILGKEGEEPYVWVRNTEGSKNVNPSVFGARIEEQEFPAPGRTDTDRLDWIGQHMTGFRWGLNCLFVDYLDGEGVPNNSVYTIQTDDIDNTEHFRNAINQAMDEFEGK